MLRNSILAIFILFIFTTNIKAEENNYPPIFMDNLASSLIKSVVYDDSNNCLYINDIELYPTINGNENHYSLTINNILFNFIYSSDNKNIIVKYKKPIDIKVNTEVSIYTLNGKTFLHVSDIDGSRDYQGKETDNKVEFSYAIANIGNTIYYLNPYLDKTTNKLVFYNPNYNFDVSIKEEKSVNLLLSGKVENNIVFAINNPMRLEDAMEGQIDDEEINKYLSNITTNLFNETYSLTKEITLKKLIDKWNKISNNNYEKETTQIACTSKDAMCEVFEKTAYLINDYQYKEIEEDSLNLVDGTQDTPKDKRIYTTDDQISYTPVTGDNLEIYKQEREKIIEYNNWTEYTEEDCLDTDDKKCRYKDFYTKYTYPYIKSEPQYTDWTRSKDLLDDPVEETDTQYTKGPYLNCTKFEEREVEVNTYTCHARDETAHKALVQCQDDPYYQKFCMSTRLVNVNKEYELEPMEEDNRDFCAKCVVKKNAIVLKDADGNEYANFNVDGKAVKIYLPKGNCIDYTKETRTEIVRGLCQIMEYKYDLYIRDYLGDIDYYEETPIIETDQEVCEEKTSKEDGKITCTKIPKTSYSFPDIRYSEWEDVDNFSDNSNVEKRYRYKEFKTNGIKIISKSIKQGEYNTTSANNIINLLAEKITLSNYVNSTNQYALLENYKNTDTFKVNKQNNMYSLENEKIFAAAIHVVENEINQLENLKYPVYTGGKVIGTSSFYLTEDIEEVLYLPLENNNDKKVVFFNKNNPRKIEESENWKDQNELLETIKESNIEESKFEITINSEQLKELNKWVAKKENRDKRNCEFIREFSNIVTKPTNFQEQLLKTTGCDF